MPHFSLAVMKGTAERHYRTKSEIESYHGKVRWQKHRTFSLVAQLLAPLSTLFSIPALSEHWYIRKVRGTTVESKPDPPLIIAAGSILLALSLLSNASILLRLLDVHCRLFTFTTLVVLVVHIVLAVITVSIFAEQRVNVPDGYSLSTAFWLTVVSAIIAFSVAASLVIDGVRTRWYSRGGTGLTGEQRSLVLVFVLFVSNIIVGAAAYRYLLEDATFIDSTYFTVQCFITVGFGTPAPTSVGARAFTIVFLTFGIVNFAIFLAFIRSTALEALKERYKARERHALERIKTRHSTIVSNHSKRGAFLIYLTCGLWHPRHDDSEAGSRSPAEPEEKPNRAERRREKRYAYEEKIEELNREQRLEFRAQLVIATVGVIFVWMFGALIFTYLEGWSYWISFYFCYVSMSTLGLGDYSPETQGGRAFFSVWSLIGAGILTVFFSVLADEYSNHYKETFQRNLLAAFRQRKHDPHHHRNTGSKQLPQRSETTSTRASNGKHIRIIEREDQTEEEIPETRSRNDRVTKLLSETRAHLQHLTTRDSSDTEVVDSVVRRVMDQEDFAIRNRELVEGDKGLKEFLFLRNLLTAFSELEMLTTEMLEEASDAKSGTGDASEGDRCPQSRTIQFREIDEKLKAG